MSGENKPVSAKTLAIQGYCRTSNRYRMASRIDREDWKEYCRATNHPAIADYYRRVLSQDTIIVSESVAKKLPGSRSSGAPKERLPKLDEPLNKQPAFNDSLPFMGE